MARFDIVFILSLIKNNMKGVFIMEKKKIYVDGKKLLEGLGINPDDFFRFQQREERDMSECHPQTSFSQVQTAPDRQ